MKSVLVCKVFAATVELCRPALWVGTSEGLCVKRILFSDNQKILLQFFGVKFFPP